MLFKWPQLSTISMLIAIFFFVWVFVLLNLNYGISFIFAMTEWMFTLQATCTLVLKIIFFLCMSFYFIFIQKIVMVLLRCSLYKWKIPPKGILFFFFCFENRFTIWFISLHFFQCVCMCILIDCNRWILNYKLLNERSTFSFYNFFYFSFLSV